VKILVDLEHTISNCSHRLHLLNKEPKDKFHEEFINDSVNENVKIFLKQLYCKNNIIFILTAKNYKYEEVVLKWLKNNKIKFDCLVMKPEDFVGSHTEFKESYIKETKISFDFSLDDCGTNCAMFFKHGIPSLRIEQR